MDDYPIQPYEQQALHELLKLIRRIALVQTYSTSGLNNRELNLLTLYESQLAEQFNNVLNQLITQVIRNQGSSAQPYDLDAFLDVVGSVVNNSDGE